MSSNRPSEPPGFKAHAMPAISPGPIATATSVTPAAAVHGRWAQYRFAEPSVPERAQLRVVAVPAMPSDLPGIGAIDPGLELLQAAIENQLARTPIAPVDYAQGRATDWFLFSPFEVFLEQVLAKKLGTLE